MAGTLKRIQDLFRQGEVVILEPRDPETGEVVERIPVYVKKLSALEKDEAIKDARSARARRVLTFDRDEDEQLQLSALLAGMTDADIHEDLLRRKAGEFLHQAEDEVRSDPKWRERLEAIDRASIVDDGAASEQERQVLADLLEEFQKAIGKDHQRRMSAHLRELRDTPREELEASYRQAWRDMLGATSFYEARRQSEIWYALRECSCELDADGRPVQGTEIIGGRLCATRADVNDLPDDVIVRVLQSLDGEMTSREAGNSGAPSASSGSSEQRSAEAASTPSTPSAT
jgi:hypothetical protein